MTNIYDTKDSTLHEDDMQSSCLFLWEAHMLQIGICDDEKVTAAVLQKRIQRCLEKNQMEGETYIFCSGNQLLESIQQLDILFLDIDMPGLDGIETGLLYRKRDKKCKIVMETSMVERMQEAFYLEAYRFLIKPIQGKELEEVFLSYQKSCLGSEGMLLMENRQCVNVMQKDIYYIQSYDSYTEFIVKDRILRSEKSLRMLEEELEARLFFRIDKKHIVNFGYIETYRDGIVRIKDKEIVVARRRKKEFEASYRGYDLEYR